MPDEERSTRNRLARLRTRIASPTVALAAFAAGLVFVVSVVVFPHHSSNHDEAVYLQQAATLVEGRLFLRPPVPDAFRPWFFVRDGGAFYSKYTPVAAAVFAAGKAVAGSYRVALAAVAAGNVALGVALGREAFDRRVGVATGALMLTAPLFLVSSSVFLSYAPATLFNLAFAYAYVRRERARAGGRPRIARRFALAAGFMAGLAFFTRPYTAVLFATPFVAHAVGTLALARDRDVVAGNALTATLGLAWVGVALAYNAVVTGDPLTFPYQAFAPEDGLGFGRRVILDYERTYTPALAVRANAEVVARLFLRWGPLGVVGTALAAVGVGRGLGRPTRERAAAAVDALARDAFDDRHVRWLLAAPFATVVLGNVAFWGNLNVLGDLDVVADGLVWTLGPYYHFDLLVPTAVFAAVGSRVAVETVRDVRAGSDEVVRTTVGALALLGVVLAATVGVGALAHPLAANYETSQHLADAYDVDREYDDAVVFLPQPYGDWLNHPLQGYRNDPGYDGDVVYALDRDGENFAVVDAFENRSYYRYTYRGEWAPFDGESVDPRVQRVRVASGDRAGTSLSLGTPNWTVRAAIELSAGDDESVAYYVNDTADGIDARLVVADGRARLVGEDVEPRAGDGSIAVDETDSVVLDAFLDSRTGTGLTYRLETPVRGGEGDAASAVLTPYVETCVAFDTCGGEAAYVPSSAAPGVSANVSVWANGTARTGTVARSASGTRAAVAVTVDRRADDANRSSGERRDRCAPGPTDGRICDGNSGRLWLWAERAADAGSAPTDLLLAITNGYAMTSDRRSFMKAAGSGIALATIGATTTSAATGWETAKSPTERTLHDVEETAGGVYVVGGGGVVLERAQDGYRKVIDGGPSGNGNGLYGADVTDDGKRLWFVGASGAIGEYDVETGSLTDRSAPMDVTNNFNDVSVTGRAGEANVYVAGDSGKLYYSFENGASETWEDVTPASGAAITAVDFHDDRSGHVVDGNQTVLCTRDGATWDRLGIENANHNFYGVDSDGVDDVRVSGGGGTIYHWNGSEWVRSDTGDAAQRDVEVGGDDDGYVVGSGGKVYDRENGEWRMDSTPTGQNLAAVVRLGDESAVAVGAGGTIIER